MLITKAIDTTSIAINPNGYAAGGETSQLDAHYHCVE